MKRWSFYCLILSCGFFLCGCDRLYRLLQKEGAEEKEIVGEAIPYEKNVKIAEVQRLLKLYGYRVGKADGILGGNTRKAIEDFQKDNDLPVTRFVDKATWERMNMFSDCGLVVNGTVHIQTVQEALKNAGFGSGPADGKAGRRTQSALLEFQKAARLKADGKIGFKTLKKLAEYLPSQDSGAQGDKAARR